MRKNLSFLQLFFLVPMVMGLVACATANQAVAPGPLAEIPSEFSVPETVGLDVTPGGSGGASSSASLTMKAIAGEGGEFSQVIQQGPDTATSLNDVLSGLLTPFTVFTIPVDPTVQTFEATRQEPDSLPQTFKMDFRKYDFDGDGIVDDFSNCTCPVGCAPDISTCPKDAPVGDLKPVGFRIWIQNNPEQPFERVMVGFFNILPVKDDPATVVNEENAGSGSFRLGRIDKNDFGAEPGEFTSTERFIGGVVYDHKDPLSKFNKTVEMFFYSTISPTKPVKPSLPKVSIFLLPRLIKPILPKKVIWKKRSKLNLKGMWRPESRVPRSSIPSVAIPAGSGMTPIFGAGPSLCRKRVLQA